MSGWRKRQIEDKMELNELNNILLSLCGSEEVVEKWWGGGNHAFDGETPKEMLDKDRDRVIGYVIRQTDGDYS
jgi:hypothetical protein